MFEVKITGTSLADLAANVSALAVALGAAPAAAPVEAKPAEAKPAKATPAKAVKAAEAKPAEKPVEPEAPAAPKLLDFNTEVAPKVVAAVESHGKELVASVLVEYGKARASEIDPALWPDFLTSLDDAIAAVSV